MMQLTNGYTAYKNNSVNFASKEQLLLMLLDGAVKFSKMSRQAIVDKDIKKAHENLMKVQDIFIELRVTLDINQGGEWARNLAKVYDFIIENLRKVNFKKDIELLDETMPIIEDIRNMWNEAYKISKR
ncbi:flagellar protein FliS [Clostridium cellulovorans 743B]|uniref:Flagellar secretion chaperone FliS n=2 Tax=Clostridium cellulovorans TaxID=1493 RepID=D9SKF5_CLOC7|nr:flagellar protein FliS [Clostridium cellulovorans 743B]